MKAFKTMLKVEFKLSLRDMNMVIFAVAMPLVITLIFGFLYGTKPAYNGANYTGLQQNFGAMSAIGIVAAGVMGLPLVLSEYREKKILKRYQCSPTSPMFLLFVQLVKYALYSVAGLCAVVLVSLCFGYTMTGNIFAFLGAYLLVLICLYSIGMVVAALAPSLQSAGLICSLLYFPMLIFSGTTLPYEVMPVWLQIIADFLPLTQGIKLLKGTSLGLPVTNWVIPLIVMGAITALCTGVAIKFFKWESKMR